MGYIVTYKEIVDMIEKKEFKDINYIKSILQDKFNDERLKDFI